MEYNKDEAIKAKGIAEKKMESKDFIEAKEFALKAQQLCSDLDGIPQMLTVIDVHCSAAQKVLGVEMDWYGILKVELTADDLLIKKQYRKLALLLHPDKNKLAGAEAAFKIIGEAHRVLSDQENRLRYDSRCKALKERSTLLKQWQNRNLPAQRQPGAGNVHGNINRTQAQSVNVHHNQPGFAKPTFWTKCPFCSTKYQYYKDVVKKALRCQLCSKPFIAFDLSVQGPASGANWTRPAASQEQKASQDGRNVGPQSTDPGLFPCRGYQGNLDYATAASSIKKAGTSSCNSEPKSKAEVSVTVEEAARRDSQNMPKFNAGKSNGKSEVELSEKYDTESSNSIEELDTPEKQKYFGISEGNDRRSAQPKCRVHYDGEKGSKNEFAGILKDNNSSTVLEDQTDGGALKTTRPADFVTGVKIDILKKQKKSDTFEEKLFNRYAKTKPSERTAKLVANGEDSKEKSKSDDIWESNSRDDGTLLDSDLIEVADAEFYFFDDDRKEDCFRKDQLWAIYDDMDSMPRFYAFIKKVYSPGFKVRIKWLEANPDDQAEIDWVNEELPVSCGKFRFEKTKTTEDINMFSHVVLNARVIQKGVFFICPAKGETWAVFKRWSTEWSSDPDNHRDYEFDFVEIVSDYDQQSGIIVAYLQKVEGFVSLFRQKKDVALYEIPANELYRFSHMVPCYKTTGKERNGVPKGSFELDPAALPTNLVDPKNI